MGRIGIRNSTEKINYDICISQAKLYEYVANEGYDMVDFSNKYLQSKFCNVNFDREWSLYHFAAPVETSYEIFKEIQVDKYEGNMVFNPDAAWWIGFTYKQLQIETEMHSKDILKEISFEELVRCYPGLHTVDEEYATDMICEYHHLKKIMPQEVDV